MKRLPVFCKNCGSKKVFWDKYFDNKGNERFVLTDLITNIPHNKNCYKQPEGKSIPIKKLKPTLVYKYE